MKHKLESRLPGEIEKTSDMQMTSPFMAESEEKLKSLLKVKEESKKPVLKPNIQKSKYMAYSPIISWQINGETMETETISLGSKITADGDCSHAIKIHLLLERITVTNLDSILKAETLFCQQRSI